MVRKLQREGRALKKRFIAKGDIARSALRDAVDYANACGWNNPSPGATVAQQTAWAGRWMDLFLAQRERLLAPLRVKASVARAGLQSTRDHGIRGVRYGCYRHAEDVEYRWGNFTGAPASVVMAVEPTDENTQSDEHLLNALTLAAA